MLCAITIKQQLIIFGQLALFWDQLWGLGWVCKSLLYLSTNAVKKTSISLSENLKSKCSNFNDKPRFESHSHINK